MFRRRRSVSERGWKSVIGGGPRGAPGSGIGQNVWSGTRAAECAIVITKTKNESSWKRGGFYEGDTDMQTATVTTSGEAAEAEHEGEAEYGAFLQNVAATFRNLSDKEPLFRTDAEGLFDVFLGALPPGRRQHYTCHSCQYFVNRFGGLMTIDEAGRASSAVWKLEATPAFFRPSVEAMLRALAKAKITSVFLSSDRSWGRALTAAPTTANAPARFWHHFAATPRSARVYEKRALTAGQAMAEKREDHHTVARALATYPKAVVDEALRVLRADALYRAEKVIGPAEWLSKLHAAREVAAGAVAKDNVLWRAVATAPAGFCHPKSSMVGTLLDDIAAGMSFHGVAARFKEKMHPLQYQRPQAAPKAGAIAQAEALVEKLGIARSLERRYAQLEDLLKTVWIPKPAREAPLAPKSGVFGHLTPKGMSARVQGLVLPPVAITWVKFRDTVLPVAEAIAFFARAGNDSYGALVTAVHADAPPILQWDREDKRNPVSWYLWNGGSRPEQWKLAPNAFVPVMAVTYKPSMWGENKLTHQGEGVFFLLEGARETRHDAGMALFPETMKSELHGVRAVIEAHSRTANLEGAEEATACGILVPRDPSARLKYRFRVTSQGHDTEHIIDRWD